uniref:Uncharacterized protein n=4 Tax=Meloidogyne enterolobii TaxID=390850 RepID=A0A6V7Y8L9_MELEN|nr:unnamed protein product [Meloidogyne enterolobii]
MEPRPVDSPDPLKRAAKRPLHVTGSSEEGSSSPKKKYNTTWLKRLEGDICPICLSVVSNKWARHCSTSHSDFVSSPYDNVFIGEEKVKTFVVSCVLALGGTNAYGQQLADIIVFADKNGFYKQGLTRLEKYLSESGKAEPLLVRENVVSVHYDGNGAPGVVVGNLCINKAMNMASNYGYGIVTVENCKDIGTAQFYTDILATNGMTGFVFSGDDGPLSVATIDKSFEFLNITPECRVILSCFAKISHKCFFAKSPNHECLLDDLTLSEDAIVITKQRKQAYQQKFDDMKGLCYLKENIAKMNEDAITRGIHPDNLLEALTGASVSGST